jgi:hypothetical protein
MQRELANAPVEVVVANHCYGLFELAAVYLSQVPPLLPQSRLAIDALACLVDGLKGRLGEAEVPLKDGLSQLQLAYVQIDAAQRAGADVATTAGVNGASDAPASDPRASDAPASGGPASGAPKAGGDPAPETPTSGTEAEPGE